MLLVDRPMADKFRSHVLILAIWMIMSAFIAVNLAGRVSGSRGSGHAPRLLP